MKHLLLFAVFFIDYNTSAVPGKQYPAFVTAPVSTR